MDLDKIAAVESPVDEHAVLEELDGFVRGWLPAEPERESRPRWEIRSIGAADWAMRKLAECQARVQQYAEEVDRWTSARDRIAKAGEFFEEHLKQWAISQRTPATKSFPLASGTMSTRETPAKVEVVNEPLAIAWAKLRKPAAVKTVETFLVKESGAKVVEVIVGLDVVDKSSGDIEHKPLTPPVAKGDLAALIEARGLHNVDPQFEVVACFDLRVMVDGEEVPGLAVRAAKVTATVAPFHP